MNIFPERVWFRTARGWASRVEGKMDKERRREMENAFKTRSPEQKKQHFERASMIMDDMLFYDWRGPTFTGYDDD